MLPVSVRCCPMAVSYLGAGELVVVYGGFGQLWQLLDAGRVVALVGHTDEGLGSAGKVDHLGRARQQRNYAQPVTNPLHEHAP